MSPVALCRTRISQPPGTLARWTCHSRLNMCDFDRDVRTCSHTSSDICGVFSTWCAPFCDSTRRTKTVDCVLRRCNCKALQGLQRRAPHSGADPRSALAGEEVRGRGGAPAKSELSCTIAWASKCETELVSRQIARLLSRLTPHRHCSRAELQAVHWLGRCSAWRDDASLRPRSFLDDLSTRLMWRARIRSDRLDERARAP